MAGDHTVVQVLAQHRNHAQLFNRFQVSDNLGGALQRVLGLEVRWYLGTIYEGEIKDALALSMAIQSTNVICGGQTEALVRLRHKIADVNLHRCGIHDGLCNPPDQEIWNQACKK